MTEQKEKAYLLGTEQAELHRLGLQHQVWSEEARRGWALAGFQPGHTLLDLGCGPGFCTTELAYIVGNHGKVIGVDLSASYTQFLKEQADLHGLPVEVQTCSFDDMQLAPASLDGAYCRWALAWVPNPAEVLAKVLAALKPGGRMVVHEYYDWATFQSEPPLPHLKNCIAACYRSLKQQAGDIDVGRRLPAIATGIGLSVVSIRPMIKLAKSGDLTWEWPLSFLKIYPPKLVERGLFTQPELENAWADLEALGREPNATMLCPTMLEVVLQKP